MGESIYLWIGFNLFILILLALDLGIFHRKAHEVKMKEALIWSFVWISLALLFNAAVYYWKGSEAALEFFVGYLIEKSLSVDNIFVFLMIFSYFSVPALYQHKILFWGIVGALIMRAMLIAVGGTLIQQFHWIIYIFGVFLILTGIKMLARKNEEIHPERNPVVKLFKKWMPVTNNYEKDHFFLRKDGKWMATPLFIVLLVVESTDLIFAVDSIPAIFAITDNPFIVYTSNVFAILGLRSLYFALAGTMSMFKYLKTGLSLVLVFVGIKMILSGFLKIPVLISLIIIAFILVTSILASLIRFERKKASENIEQNQTISSPDPAQP